MTVNSPPKIVVIGSINQDLVIRLGQLPAPGETVTAQSLSEIAGGKGANQAVAASRVGGNVTMIGHVGTDAFAESLRAGLQAEAIDCQHVTVVDGPSGIAVVAVENSGENAIMVVPGANGRLNPEALAAAEQQIASADMVVLQLEIPIDTVIAAIEIAERHDVPVMIDPAPAPPLNLDDSIRKRLCNVWLICPNESEAASLLCNDIESTDDTDASLIARAKRTAKALLCTGPQVIVLTLGQRGALIATAEGTRHIPAMPIEAVDTTAAGDAFAGTLAVTLSRIRTRSQKFTLDELEQAAKIACVAGSIAASRHGAVPSLPNLTELRRFVDPSLL